MSNNRETEPTAAREFVSYWTGRGYEKGQTQPFWIGLLRVLGVECPDQGFIEFEDKANIDAAHGFIDGYIPATHVMIEQKSLGKDLRAAIRQSDGSPLSPYQPAKRCWIRVSGTLVDDDRREAKQSMLDAYPGLKKMYSPDDGNTQVLYFAPGATATIDSFPDTHIVLKF